MTDRRKEETEQSFIINNEFCFKQNPNPGIVTIQNALKTYNNKLSKEISLESQTPIFLDTNVLLDYYKLSFSERKALLKFLEENKNRFILTGQVEQEFLNQRVDHIKSYLNSVEEFVNAYRNIKSEIDNLKKGEIKGFKHYLENNKILKNDHQDLHTELKQLHETLSEKLKSLFNESDLETQLDEKEARIEEIKKRLEGDADIERNDPLLEVISQFTFINKMEEREIEYCKELYKELSVKYEEVKSNQKEFYKYTFPGCGDKKLEPEGDLIIYHEILKYMKENDTDAIFLTNDTEKNDWLLRQKTELIPFSHYIVNTYVNTGNTLYIFQSRDKIRLTYDPIYIDEEIDRESESIVEDEEKKFQGIKVVGKIELPVNNRHRQSNFDFYEEISEEEFIKQLKQSEEWAERYGDGFVGVRNFVENFLGGKGFNYWASYAVKDRLVENGTIEEYKHEPEESFYNPVTAIKMKQTVDNK